MKNVPDFKICIEKTNLKLLPDLLTMKNYKEYKSLDLPSIDKEILSFWKENGVFEKSVSNREDKEQYIFYEGPPSANGMPGIHHVMARTIKDLFCRYKTMRGFQVKRKGGWDTHGLPVELGVEKMLGITKEDIGKKISIAEYNAACRKDVMKFKDVWDDITQKMGYWVDLKNPYITFENNYIESVWFLLKKLYEKKLLYKGYSIQPYSPAAGTGLSSHELNLPGCYKMVKDTTVIAQFRLIPNPSPKEKGEIASTQKSLSFGEGFRVRRGEDLGEAYFLAWTTTPWTLPSNTGLAVGEKIIYAVVKTFNQYTYKPITVILAKDLMQKYFDPKNEVVEIPSFEKMESLELKKIPFKIIGEIFGRDLEGIRYEQLLPFIQPKDGDSFKVVIGDFVSTEDGTGIVHLAPSFGADDFRMAKKYELGSLTLVDKEGKFTEEMGEFAGRYVKNYKDDPNWKDIDVDIAVKLKKENKAFKIEKYEHSYPHCWRTDKPILYYPLDSWFIKTTACKKRMVELNKTINWKPSFTGTGRFENWLENLVDWNLSRSRYWGIPLPIWRTEDGKEEICIGSVEQFKVEVEKATSAGIPSTLSPQPSTLDLHRPFVDEIILVSPTGKKMYRETDLIDVWFDSGAMPFAQWGAKSEDDKTFRKNFPADFIAEGVDQTRGWFFTLHAIAVMLFDSVAYKNVVSNGLVLDKNGNKMSKRLGNAVDPFETIEKFGADATRWYMISNSQPWDNLKFDSEGIKEVQRSFFGTLFNIYSFFALYANIDHFLIDEKDIVPVAERTELDKWIISKLHSLVKEVTRSYEDYEPTRAARAIANFVDEHLSNWYVRLSRRRFWKGELTRDKKAAYETLFECLMVTAQLSSPIAPFFAEWLYKNLSDGVRDFAKKNSTPLSFDSIHLTNWTTVEEKVIDKLLEERMQLAQDISSLILSLRKKVNIKVRQPLQKMLIPVLNENTKLQIEKIKNLILAEVNVKEIEYVSDTSGILVKKIKPNFKLLGAKMGKKMKELGLALTQLSQKEIAQLEKNGSIDMKIDGEPINILKGEVEILSEDIAGWMVANKDELAVALDINLTEKLKNEGLAREFVNRIQKLRKESDFNVTDRIIVLVQKDKLINNAIIDFKLYICSEILAENLEIVDNLEAGVPLEVNDNQLLVSVTKKLI